MPRRNCTGSTLVTSLPSTVNLPAEGSIIRLIIRIEVVLPHPDGPTNTARVPSGTSSDRSSTATVPSGYFLVTRSKLIMCSPLHRLVEAVVLYPLAGRLIGIDAVVARRRRVHLDEGLRGELGRHRVEHRLELIRHLLRSHQRNDVGGKEVVLGVLQRDEVLLRD